MPLSQQGRLRQRLGEVIVPGIRAACSGRSRAGHSLQQVRNTNQRLAGSTPTTAFRRHESGAYLCWLWIGAQSACLAAQQDCICRSTAEQNMLQLGECIECHHAGQQAKAAS
jgi:hypothetical protein